MTVGRDQVEAPSELEPQRAERLTGGRRLVGDDQQQVALGRLQALPDRRRSPARRGTSRSASASPSAWTNAHTSPLAPCCLATSVSASSSARDSSRAPALMPRTTPPDVERTENTLNSEPVTAVAEIVELEAEAGVGAVGAEPRDRLGVRHPRPRRRRARSNPLEPRTRPPITASVRVDHVVLVDERHLDVELRELRLPVGALVLVAEAAGDLVVALEPADHQQLLEQLRRLRQRVERPGLECAPARGSRARPRASSGSGSASRSRGSRARRAPSRIVADRLVAERQRVAHRRPAQVERRGGAGAASRRPARPRRSGTAASSASARISSSVTDELDLARWRCSG